MKKYLVSWWKYDNKRDEYVDFDMEVFADSEEEAINIVKQTRRGKHFTAKLWD